MTQTLQIPAPQPRMVDTMARLVAGEVPPPPAGLLLGLRLARYSNGEATAELPVTAAHDNAMGMVMGGIVSALADAAMGWAYMTTLAPGDTSSMVELKINFLRPALRSPLLAHARVLKRGREIALVECHVRYTDGELVAHATSTCLRRPWGDSSAGSPTER